VGHVSIVSSAHDGDRVGFTVGACVGDDVDGDEEGSGVEGDVEGVLVIGDVVGEVVFSHVT
jgi:hypothetical protein